MVAGEGVLPFVWGAGLQGVSFVSLKLCHFEQAHCGKRFLWEALEGFNCGLVWVAQTKQIPSKKESPFVAGCGRFLAWELQGGTFNQGLGEARKMDWVVYVSIGGNLGGTRRNL